MSEIELHIMLASIDMDSVGWTHSKYFWLSSAVVMLKMCNKICVGKVAVILQCLVLQV